MNTSLENLTHKMQRAALGKIVDVRFPAPSKTVKRR